MSDRNFIFGYFFARRHATPWKQRERTRPKMPSTPWRLSALASVAIGVLAAWLLFRGASSIGWRMVAGGVAGFVVGMYIVESIWERRLRAAEAAGPIGKRH